MAIELIDTSVTLDKLKKMAEEQFAGELVKAVVDIEKNLMAIGGAMHADEEAFLLEQGSEQQNLWGINLRPNDEDLIEFDSMINIRPSQNNRSRSVEDLAVQEEIRKIVAELVK